MLGLPHVPEKDGPFCRALPELGVGQPRHQPFTLDSIVPQHLFGDPRASMERLGSKATGGSAARTERATKQATAVLNRFLEHFSKIKDATLQQQPSEPSSRKATQKLQTSAFHSDPWLGGEAPNAGRPFLQLPPHMSEGRVLSDLDYLITTLNVGLLSPEDQEQINFIKLKKPKQ
eukprot:Skav220864  [mRNA]  locus=scaffold193:261617:272858:+ [translate_table: standard]